MDALGSSTIGREKSVCGAHLVPTWHLCVGMFLGAGDFLLYDHLYSSCSVVTPSRGHQHTTYPPSVDCWTHDHRRRSFAEP